MMQGREVGERRKSVELRYAEGEKWERKGDAGKKSGKDREREGGGGVMQRERSGKDGGQEGGKG